MPMNVRFWGVRGSYPVPGPSTVRYGGNTSCVEVRLGPDPGLPRIIIDAGTGLRRLGKEMMLEEFGVGTGEAHLLVSHTHWDHIQGLPFFAPMYHAGNRFQVYARQRGDQHLSAVFASQSETPYFPVPFDAAAATVDFTELSDEARFEIGPVQVRCTRLNHPWIAIAYRLDYEGHSVAYVTDTAPFRDLLIEQQFIHKPPRPGDPLPQTDARELQHMRQGVVRLCEGADLVIYDTQFTPAEYEQRPHWGHSCPSDAIEIASEAGARAVVLFHHAPERTDEQIDGILAAHQALLRASGSRLGLCAAYEGLELSTAEAVPPGPAPACQPGPVTAPTPTEAPMKDPPQAPAGDPLGSPGGPGTTERAPWT